MFVESVQGTLLLKAYIWFRKYIRQWRYATNHCVPDRNDTEADVFWNIAALVRKLSIEKCISVVCFV